MSTVDTGIKLLFSDVSLVQTRIEKDVRDIGRGDRLPCFFFAVSISVH